MATAWKRYIWVGATVLALAAVASPAHAANNEDEPYIYSGGTSVFIAPGSAGKTTEVWVYANNAKNPKIALDLSLLAGVATVAAPAGCTASGTDLTCPLPEGSEQSALIPLAVRPASGVQAGAWAPLRWTTVADNVAEDPGAIYVNIEDGVDLVAAVPFAEYHGVPPGAEIRAPVGGVNLGNRSTATVSLLVVGYQRMQPAQHDGCRYSVEDEVRVALCELAFNPPLGPGEGFELKDGFGLITGADAYDESPYTVIEPADAAAVVPDFVRLREGAGPPLVVNRIPAGPRAAGDLDDRDNRSQLWVTVDNAADVQALGTGLSPAPAPDTDLSVGVRNRGPATIDNPEGGSAVSFEFTVPPGTEVAEVGNPERCAVPNGDQLDPAVPGKPVYVCFTDQELKAGAAQEVTFALKVTQVIPGAKGQVRVLSASGVPDPNPANNTADVIPES